MRPALRHIARAAGFALVVAAAKAVVALVPPTGLLRDDLFPLWMRWERGGAGGWLLVPLAAALAAILPPVRRRLATASPSRFVASLGALLLVATVGLAASNGGLVTGLTGPLLRDEDYFSNVSRFDSAGAVLSDWVGQQAMLSLHGRTHPPGAVVLLAVLDRLARGNAVVLSLLVVILGLTTVAPLHAWAREELGDAGARRATLLWATTPSVLLYGATCLDMVFAVPLVAAAWCLAGSRAVTARRAAAGGTALALGAMLTFSAALAALGIGLVATARALSARPRSLRRLVPLAIGGATCVAALAFVRWTTGFDWIASLCVAMRADAREWPAWSSAGYYAVTRAMGVLDFLVLLGPALAASWCLALVRSRPGPGAPAVLSRAAAGATVAALLAGAYKIGETGRILLFFLPFVTIPVARELEDERGALAVACALGVAQALVFEAVLDTRW